MNYKRRKQYQLGFAVFGQECSVVNNVAGKLGVIQLV